MKKCVSCDVEMIDNCDIADSNNSFLRTYISICSPENEFPNYETLKARICPKCGKIELYIELNENNK